MASDFSYPITSPWDDQRGSSYGLADLDPVQEVLTTLDLAKETPRSTPFFFDLFALCRWMGCLSLPFPFRSPFPYCLPSLTFIFIKSRSRIEHGCSEHSHFV